jgi:hypothetical protein
MALLTASLVRTVCAETANDREYHLKAAFLYNFVMFVDGERFKWETKAQDPEDPNDRIQIGIIGKAPFDDAFEALKNKKIRDRSVVVKKFKGLSELADDEGRYPEQHPQLDAIRQCHVLFICGSERAHIETLLRPLRTAGILTVADSPGFLEAGGMINFVIEQKKVRFEVNTAAAGRAKLQIRAKLLRLAKRVILHDAFEEPDGQEKEEKSEAQ